MLVTPLTIIYKFFVLVRDKEWLYREFRKLNHQPQDDHWQFLLYRESYFHNSSNVYKLNVYDFKSKISTKRKKKKTYPYLHTNTLCRHTWHPSERVFREKKKRKNRRRFCGF